MKYILVAFFCSHSFFSFSQITIINRSLTDSSLNIVYLGVDNRITIKGINKNLSFTVSVANGTIEKDPYVQNEYVFRMYTTDSSVLTIKQSGKIIARKAFKGEILESLVARLANITDSILSVNQILTNPFLSAVIPNSFYKSSFNILGFDATFFKQELLKTNATTNKLSSEQVRMIKDLKPRDSIYFDNIRGTEPGGRIQKLPSFKIIIK